VQLIGVSVEAQLLALALQYAELRLHQLTVTRPQPLPLDPPWPPGGVAPAAAAASPGGGAAAAAALPDGSPLRSASASSRPVPGQEVLGLHPVRSGRQAAAGDMPLALWMQWQAGQAAEDGSGSSGGGAPEAQSASLRVGRLFAAHVPGFTDQLQRFLSPDSPAGGVAAAGAAEVNAVPVAAGSNGARRGSGATQELPPVAPLPPLLARWLAAELTVDAAVSAVQLAALASATGPAEVLLLDVAKISGQLGPLRARAHGLQHTATAALLARPRGGPPSRGLRLALSGVQLSTAAVWPSAPRSSFDSGAGSPARGDRGAAGVAELPEAVSGAADLQLLMVACSGDGLAKATAGGGGPHALDAGDSWAAWSVLSGLSLRLTAVQLAAASAAVSGFSAGLYSALQPADAASEPVPAALAELAVSLAPLHMAYSPLGMSAVSAAASTAPAQQSQHSSFSMSTELLEVTVTAGSDASDGTAAALACHQISMAAAPGLSLRIPLIEAGFSRHADGNGSPAPAAAIPAAAGGADRQHSGMPCRLAGFALRLTEDSINSGSGSGIDLGGGAGTYGKATGAIVSGADSQRQQPSQSLSVRLHSLSAALEPCDWQAAVLFAHQLTAGPLLLPHTSYALPESGSGAAGRGLHVSAALGAAVISVQTADGGPSAGDWPQKCLGVSLAGASYRSNLVNAAIVTACMIHHSYALQTCSCTPPSFCTAPSCCPPGC